MGRVRRFFGAVGRFFGAIGGVLGRAYGWFRKYLAPILGCTLTIVVLVLIVAEGGIAVHFMRDSDYHRGLATQLVRDNADQKEELDTAAVEIGGLKSERDSFLEASQQLLAANQKLQAQMAGMLRFEQVQWCDMRQNGQLVMPEELLPEEQREVVTLTASFAREVDSDIEFFMVCVSVGDILMSPVRGETVFRVTRYYPDGVSTDWLDVYWQAVPGSTIGEFRTVGFYNVLERQFCPLDEATQKIVCPER